ncbi:acetolactate synthase I/II/III large subunit [Candidatus Nanopelagicus limnes]|jgi:thiamine pyrophosphate-dependent acetolactate synthase large subunit-like protein|uniref:Acetolactate synthase I/II/III large subunit n=1 Tax=Candidatus Nanopelagicus limnae TaxID=1884634 RepID=A0A249JXQ1_9ACTN|nr:thiamine pyrophosphate-binding protein [Candidatus Nanopelagicus limnes]ASY09289.1 acetolactate synthase I/II/III large subunit [Candidatus Nanopelagicus limnes]
MEGSTRTVAAVILDLLANEGVKKAFGIPGVHNLGFWNALSKDRPEIVSVRHEQSCVYAADGLARATGKLSVAITTTGPGAANTLGAFGEAAISGSHLLLISSEAPIKNRSADGARGILHEMDDQSALFTPLAKRIKIGNEDLVLAKSCKSAEDAVATVVDFLQFLSVAPAGVGYIGVPSDVLNQEFNQAVPDLSDKAVAYLAQEKNREINFNLAKDLLAGVNKIGIWAGGGATNVSGEIAALADHLSAPIFTSFAGRGVGAVSKNYLNIPIHETEAEQLLAECEALLIFGSQLDGMNTKNWSIKFPKKILLVDANPKIALRNVSADLVLQTSDISSVITALKSIPARSSWAEVSEISTQARKRIAASDKGKAGMALVTAIEKSWPSENYIVCDMAISGYWTGVYLQAKRARQISYPVGWGTLGFGLPASLGPSSAGVATLVICGDGGIAFGLGELATVAQEQLPLTILLHDDGGYGMLRFDQQVMKHPERGVNLYNPDWQVLAKSFGIEFIQTNLAELSEVLAKRSVNSTPGIVLIQDPIYPPKSTSPRWSEK